MVYPIRFVTSMQIITGTFRMNTNTAYLLLTCRLTSIDLNNLTRLQQLYLSYNYLSQLENLSDLKSLRVLDLGHNFIRSYSPLGKLEGIISLSLKSNDIHRLNEFQDFK